MNRRYEKEAQKPHVLFYTTVFSSTGGGQHAMSLLAQELSKRNYRIELFTRPPFDQDHRYVKWLSEFNVPVRVLHRFEEYWYVRLGRVLTAIMTTLPYCIAKRCGLTYSWAATSSIYQTIVAKIEQQYIFSRLSASIRHVNRRVILQIWGPAALTPMLLDWAASNKVSSIYHEMGEGDEKYIETWHLQPTVASINSANEVICCSQSVAECIYRVYGFRGRIKTIPFMIMDPGDAWVGTQKNSMPITFGAIGRLVPHKRHKDLIQALKELTDRGIDAALVIAGNGPMRESLEELAVELGVHDRVTFTGEFEKLDDVMAKFDVFTLTSSSESQCMPITESMSYGKPVIASNFGGIPDFVEHGRTGFLVPIGDLDKLVEAMQTLIQNPNLRREMGRRGRELYEARYSPEKIADAMEEAYAYLEK